MARVKYETNGGTVLGLILSTAKIALYGTQPGGAALPFNASVSGSSRKRTGVRCRRAIYTRNIGTVEAPSIRTLIIPKATAAALDAATETVTYKGATWNLTSIKGEDY